MTDENYEARAQAHLASLKRDMKESMEDAVVRAVYKVMAEFEAKSDKRLMEDWGPGPHECHSLPAREPEQPTIPQGWKLVPVKPTPEQIKSGNKVTWPMPCKQVYTAMLKAAPQPAQRKPLTDEQERKAFEAWCFSVGLMHESHGIRSVSSHEGAAWGAWKARAAHDIKGDA